MKNNKGTFSPTFTREHEALWTGLKEGRLAGRIFKIRKADHRDEIEFFCPAENISVEIYQDPSKNLSRPLDHVQDKAASCVLQVPIDRIREDIGLVLAQIRGHFGKRFVVV